MRSGAQVLAQPDPTSAPFEIDILTPQRERLKLICYAFTANKYGQKNRPADEHRFQVKYGSDFKSYHSIFIASRPEQVTLFFGAHLDERIFIACDPAMHRWTRFSRSVEFKSEHVQLAQESGWYGWERERSQTRRQRPAPRDDFRTEILLAFRPENFLRYVSLERVATGLDPGERLLLVDRMRSSTATDVTSRKHPLEVELGISADKILDIVGAGFRLHAAVRGSVAEYQLGRVLERTPGLSRVRKLDRDSEPDFAALYLGKTIRIECKNTLRKKVGGSPRVDFQKTRASIGNPCSRYYRAEQFEILAACLHPITETWEFRFCRTKDLDPHTNPTCSGHLSPNVRVEGDRWTDSLTQLLDGLES